MKARQTSGDSGQEYFSPYTDSKSQNALYPELYLAHVALATEEFTREEKVWQVRIE